MVDVDVKNAFNTADWTLIIARFEEIGVSRYLVNLTRDYIYGRSIIIHGGDTVEVTAGVSQGSVIGPTL